MFLTQYTEQETLEFIRCGQPTSKFSSVILIAVIISGGFEDLNLKLTRTMWKSTEANSLIRGPCTAPKGLYHSFPYKRGGSLPLNKKPSTEPRYTTQAGATNRLFRLEFSTASISVRNVKV